MSTTQMPAELAEVIALHRQMFGGYVMTEGAGTGAQDGGTGTNTGTTGTNPQGGPTGAQEDADEWDPAGFDPQKPATWHPSARTYVQNLREEARTLRTSQEAAVNSAREEARQELAKQLGLIKTDEKGHEDPNPNEDLLAVAQMEGMLQRAELVVWRNASTLGVDPGALTDSRSFEAAILKLDPDADDFDEQVQEAVKKVLKANPKLQGGTTPPSKGGTDFIGGTGERRNAQPLSLEAAVGGYYAK